MKKIFTIFAALTCVMSMSALTYNVTVPAGTKACYIAGEMNGWSHTEMTKVDDTHYTIEIASATEAMAYKYCSGPDWKYVEKNASGGDISDRKYSAADKVAKWASVYNPDVVVETKDIVYSVTVPEGTHTCYIAGDMTSWGHKEMTKVDATHYTITLKAATDDAYKYCSGPDWKYVELKADGGDVQNRTYAENDVVEKWKAVYGEPLNVDYVLMGIAGDWTTGVPMTLNENVENEEYMLLGQTISVGDSIKVVRLENGNANHWCGNVKDGCKDLVLENTVNDNIVLAPGVYDFYYDVASDQIWIAASSSTALDNVAVEQKAVKVIRNGQMYILRDGILYNAIGAQVAE